MTTYSYEMQEIINNLTTIRHWIGLGNNFETCENCGGWGFFSLTIASAGPFSTPTAHGSSVTSEILGTNVVWYDTRTTCYTCPICNGMRRLSTSRPIARPALETIAAITPQSSRKIKRSDTKNTTISKKIIDDLNSDF